LKNSPEWAAKLRSKFGPEIADRRLVIKYVQGASFQDFASRMIRQLNFEVESTVQITAEQLKNQPLDVTWLKSAYLGAVSLAQGRAVIVGHENKIARFGKSLDVMDIAEMVLQVEVSRAINRSA
jgi:hypothetical protein